MKCQLLVFLGIMVISMIDAKRKLGHKGKKKSSCDIDITNIIESAGWFPNAETINVGSYSISTYTADQGTGSSLCHIVEMSEAPKVLCNGVFTITDQGQFSIQSEAVFNQPSFSIITGGTGDFQGAS